MLADGHQDALAPLHLLSDVLSAPSVSPLLSSRTPTSNMRHLLLQTLWRCASTPLLRPDSLDIFCTHVDVFIAPFQGASTMLLLNSLSENQQELSSALLLHYSRQSPLMQSLPPLTAPCDLQPALSLLRSLNLTLDEWSNIDTVDSFALSTALLHRITRMLVESTMPALSRAQSASIAAITYLIALMMDLAALDNEPFTPQHKLIGVLARLLLSDEVDRFPNVVEALLLAIYHLSQRGNVPREFIASLLPTLSRYLERCTRSLIVLASFVAGYAVLSLRLRLLISLLAH